MHLSPSTLALLAPAQAIGTSRCPEQLSLKAQRQLAASVKASEERSAKLSDPYHDCPVVAMLPEAKPRSLRTYYIYDGVGRLTDQIYISQRKTGQPILGTIRATDTTHAWDIYMNSPETITLNVK